MDTETNDMLPDDDLKHIAVGVRGKYYKVYRDGHVVKIRKEDGAVILEPDVREYFPDSESVNQALRSLTALIPKRRSAAGRAK